MGTIVLAGDDVEWLIGQRKPVCRGISLAEASSRLGKEREVSVYRVPGSITDIQTAFGTDVGIWMHKPTLGTHDVLLVPNRDGGYDWYENGRKFAW